MLSAEICWKFYQVIRVASDIPRRDTVSLDSNVLYLYSRYCLMPSILEKEPKTTLLYGTSPSLRRFSRLCQSSPGPRLLVYISVFTGGRTVLGPEVEQLRLELYTIFIRSNSLRWSLTKSILKVGTMIFSSDSSIAGGGGVSADVIRGENMKRETRKSEKMSKKW